MVEFVQLQLEKCAAFVNKRPGCVSSTVAFSLILVSRMIP